MGSDSIKILEQAKKIRLLILDVDGVLTDGTIFYTDQGTQAKKFHVHDGVGMQMLMRSGIEIAVISGKESAAARHRLVELGVKYIYQGIENKTVAFCELKRKLNLENQQIAYVGDDLPDLPVLAQAGLKIAVANAVSVVLENVDWVASKAGGYGAVREVCEMILHAQGALDVQRAYYQGCQS